MWTPGRAPDSTSASGTQATASVVPSGVLDLGLPRLDGGREDQVDAVEVLLATVRSGADELLVVDPEQATDGGVEPGLLRDLPGHGGGRRLTVVEPAAGQASTRRGAGRAPSCG